MTQFTNLPGIYITKEDGNLKFVDTIPGEIVLVLGTSPEGPINTPVLVQDTIQIEKLFDPNGTKTGTLVRGMYEALTGGAKYVAVVRLDAPAVFDSSISETKRYEILYQALEKAYFELETVNVDAVVPLGVYLDAPLRKGIKIEYNNEPLIVFVDDNAIDTNGNIIGDNLTSDSLPLVNSTGIDFEEIKTLVDGKLAHEFNFGFQLASFLHNLSINQTEAFGVLPVMPPNSLLKADINAWLGKLPTVDANGNVTVNGSGVLGNKFMTGSTSRPEGFFATTNGYVDGPVVVDARNMKIDIGRYIDIIATPVIIRNSYDATLTGYLSPGAALYAGFVISLEPNVSPTNKKLPGDIRLAFKLHKNQLDQLVYAKYVAFTETFDGKVKVVDAPTAALKTSDWRRRMTNRIVGAILDWVREVADPFIGTVTKEAIRQQLEDTINNGLTKFQALNWLEAGQATVRQTPQMVIEGTAALRLQLIVPGELRQINVYVQLSK